MRTVANALILSVAALTTFTAMVGAQSSRNRAGVLIVENSRPAWTAREQLSLAAKPRLAIGDNRDTSYRFLKVEGAMLLADGRIVAVDVALKRLRVFDAQGRFLSSDGSGPWQVPAVHEVRRLVGDTIAIRTGLASLMLFSNAGQFIRTVQLPPSDEAQRGGRFWLHAVFTSRLGVAAQAHDAPRPPVGTQVVDSVEMQLVTDSDSSGRELATLPNLVFEERGNGLNTVFLAPTGTFTASNDRFYAGFGDQYAIRVYTPGGRLQSIIRRAWTPVPITEYAWEQWVVASTDRLGRMTGAERVEQLQQFRQYPRANVVPTFSQMIVDRTGRLWVREAHLQDAIGSPYLTGPPAVPSKWSVFDVGGRWLGDVTMPTGFRPFEIGADYVIGSLRSEGVIQVVIFDLGARTK